jgi:transposase
MLTMAQVNCIREMFFEKGMKYADIARATGYDVKTVKKYICMEDFNQPPPKLIEKRGSKLDGYKKEIDAWLDNAASAYSSGSNVIVIFFLVQISYGSIGGIGGMPNS